MKFTYFFAVLVVYLIFPKSAWAWGPGAHLTYALHALEQGALLAPGIAYLLREYPKVFLYGTIAADIIFAKKYAGELYHCHHWDVALSLLGNAKRDQDRAFLYGYLGHLAVDTVAHNYYVPYKIIASYEARTLRHTYWEMRFDEKMSPQVWGHLHEIAQEDFQEFDVFLAQNLKRTLFGFKTNKRIFNSLMLLQRMNKWRQASALLSRRSAFPLEDKEVRHFLELCCEVLVEFFQDPERARVRNADPSGNLKLLYAKEMVRDLRNYQRRALLSPQRIKKFIEEIRISLEAGLYKPSDLPLITDALH